MFSLANRNGNFLSISTWSLHLYPDSRRLKGLIICWSSRIGWLHRMRKILQMTNESTTSTRVELKVSIRVVRKRDWEWKMKTQFKWLVEVKWRRLKVLMRIITTKRIKETKVNSSTRAILLNTARFRNINRIGSKASRGIEQQWWRELQLREASAILS